MDKQRIRAVGLGLAGSGAFYAWISLLVVENDYWLLMTGTMFVLIGIIIILFGNRLASQKRPNEEELK